MITIDLDDATAFLQRGLFGDELQAIAAVWHVVLRSRSMMVCGLKFKDRADLLNHLHALLELP